MAAVDSQGGIRDTVVRYGDLVKTEMDVKQVYLYGSYVRGSYSADSDIDVAVVGDDFSGDPVEDTLKLMRIRRQIDYRIEPRPFKTCEFVATNPLAREIMSTGIRVM